MQFRRQVLVRGLQEKVEIEERRVTDERIAPFREPRAIARVLPMFPVAPRDPPGHVGHASARNDAAVVVCGQERESVELDEDAAPPVVVARDLPSDRHEKVNRVEVGFRRIQPIRRVVAPVDRLKVVVGVVVAVPNGMVMHGRREEKPGRDGSAAQDGPPRMVGRVPQAFQRRIARHAKRGLRPIRARRVHRLPAVVGMAAERRGRKRPVARGRHGKLELACGLARTHAVQNPCVVVQGARPHRAP